MKLSLTAQERRIIGAALPAAARTNYYQPQQADLAAADGLIGRGLLEKAAGWDYLTATPEGVDVYWADRDDIAEQRHQHRLHRVGR